MREEAVVGKEARATEQVRLNKTVGTETETVGGDVRREEVETEGDTTGFGSGEYTTTDRQSTNY
jgi:stress response protein YsnF